LFGLLPVFELAPVTGRMDIIFKLGLVNETLTRIYDLQPYRRKGHK